VTGTGIVDISTNQSATQQGGSKFHRIRCVPTYDRNCDKRQRHLVPMPARLSTPPPQSAFSSSSSPPTSSSSSSKKKQTKQSEKNIFLLKWLLFFSLAFAGSVSGSLSYYFIYKQELLSSKNDFIVMADDHYRSLDNLLHIQTHLNMQLAMIMGFRCKTIEEWPECFMTSQEYLIRTRSLLAMAEVHQFHVSVLVRKNNSTEFETRAHEYYSSDGGYRNATDISEHIYDLSSNTATPTRSASKSTSSSSTFTTSSNSAKFGSNSEITSVDTPSDSPDQSDLLIPTLLVSNLTDVRNYLQDLYSDPQTQHIINAIFDCVDTTSTAGIEPNAQSYHLQHECSRYVAYSPSLSLSSGGGDYSLVLTPIFAGNDLTLTRTIVGFTSAIFSWRDVLIKTPHHGSDFYFTVQSTSSSSSSIGTWSHTYHTNRGEVSEKTHGGVPSARLGHEKTFRLETNPDLPSSTTPFTLTYTSTVHSSSLFFPVITCVCCVGMTLIISLIFFAYMTLKDREMLETNLKLESKRTYVRFISHEIRCESSPNPLSLCVSLILSLPLSLSLSLSPLSLLLSSVFPL
jgi:hypothetical protein